MFYHILKLLAVAVGVVLIVVAGIYLYVIMQTTKQGDIAWQSCYHPKYLSWFTISPPTRLQCAIVHVPVNHAKPDGKQFAIPLTRLPSNNPNAIGDLLILNGGPGGHSLDTATFLPNDEPSTKIQNSFHLIGYAPRGVAPSTPSIDCGGTDEDDAQAYMQACVERIGADVLPFISSKDVVQDLDVIRQKLGNQTWSMLGYSYGTKLVAKYAERYPYALRAGVLDGVVDTSEDLFTILNNQYKYAQIAFDEFIKRCPDTCVFDKNKDVNQAFIETLKTIENKKLTDKNGDMIDSESILEIFNENLGDEYYWQDLYTMFGELHQGKTHEYNTQKLISEFGEKSFSEDALTLINCADSAPKLSKDEYIQAIKAIDKQARYDDIKPKKDDEYLDACYYWVYPATDDLTENLITKNTPNLLFVAQKFDFATPLANAITMTNRFDDTLVYTPNYGHTVSLSGTNACVDSSVVRYLLDPKQTFDSKMMFCE